ncbi:MAG: carbohydrate ABC transporter permease, partial [Anaerolineae bacterium]|nr:carbohydrate ABC transporter permease [Anaerolineae bacterium]
MVNQSASLSGHRSLRGRLSDRLPSILWRVLIYTILCAGCVIVLIPLVWMISTALKDLKYVFVFPPEWIPDPIEWGNFSQALTILPFGMYFKNTMVIASISLVAAALSSSIVAYGFARLDFPARDALFLVMLSTLMIPAHVTLVPRYIMFNWFGLVDTIIPLIAQAFFGSPVYIFLLRQFFLTIPLEMDEAALIDGCSKWSILWRIILPQSLPALGIVAIFSFLFHWNEFLSPLIYLNSPEKRTLA